MTAASRTWRARLAWPLSWLACAVLPSSVTLPAVLCQPVLSTLHSLTLDRIFAAAVLLPLTWSVASTLAVYPHELSYFNEIAGGPFKGHEHLLDANLDWGQDLLALKDWYDAHFTERPLRLAYFGTIEPQLAGICSDPIPAKHTEAPSTISPATGYAPSQGWYAISINRLCGYKHYGFTDGDYSWLMQSQPVDYAGYAIRVDYVSVSRSGALRDEFTW